jgi:hypothetical protein
MAAVLALIMLPLAAALGSVVSITHTGLADFLTMLTVVALGGGALYGLLRFIPSMEEPEKP